MKDDPLGKSAADRKRIADHGLLRLFEQAQQLAQVVDQSGQNKPVGIAVVFCGIDGRLSDLDSKQPADLLPLIGDRWTSHFKWRGKGPMPAAEKKKLRQIVEKAHARGRRVRFWATPESPPLWKALSTAGVDLINTDRLADLQRFLEQDPR